MSSRSARPSRREHPSAKPAAARRSPLRADNRDALQAEQARLGNRAFNAALQREVAPPGDPLEREADRTAERVLRMPQAGLPRDPPPRPGAGSAERVVQAPGQPLDPATRAFMEPRFGRDFSNVRVHSDAAAQ